jgi:hypothetical protein
MLLLLKHGQWAIKLVRSIAKSIGYESLSHCPGLLSLTLSYIHDRPNGRSNHLCARYDDAWNVSRSAHEYVYTYENFLFHRNV